MGCEGGYRAAHAPMLVVTLGAMRAAEILNMGEWKRYPVVWPSFLDSEKTVQRGRRVPKDAAVASPTVEDISEVCQQLGLWHVVEPYCCYPREPYVEGRVRVRLWDAQGQPCNGEVPTRKGLHRRLAQDIPGLDSRLERLLLEAEAKEHRAAQEAALKKQAAAQSSGGGGGGAKKKKKKGKK